MRRYLWISAICAISLLCGACTKKAEEAAAPAIEQVQEDKAMPADHKNVDLSQLTRMEFNKAALRLNVPLYWIYEAEESKTVRPEVLVDLKFYHDSGALNWKDEDGKFTEDFYALYEKLVNSIQHPVPEGLSPEEATRREHVIGELDQAFTNVVFTDFSGSQPAEKQFVAKMLEVAKRIDDLYARQTGVSAIIDKVPADDPASQSMFRRNWSAKPESAKYKADEKCVAIPGFSKMLPDVYPEDIQQDNDFCKVLESEPNASEILHQFVVVRHGEEGKGYVAIPYSEHYKAEMTAISDALKDAASVISEDPNEVKLHAYLMAAAQSFLDNNWDPADEAWAVMDSHNSKWYVRVAPDETYWEPCNRKAGFHMTFARINPDALQWQDKLSPIEQEMENKLAEIAGKPYEAREVNFHLPDGIDIVTNAGDDRDPFGATIGQSLPNWGPVANGGRGRTVVMSNLYTDPDSIRDRIQLASSIFSPAEVTLLKDSTGPGQLSTIIHEATHNLGPAHEYTVNGKVDDDIFGGQLATFAEELKAQTGALWFLPMLLEKGIIDQSMYERSYADAVYWAFGHIASGLYTADKRIRPYPQLAAVQVGTMLDAGALVYHPDEMSPNGKDKGVFTIVIDKMPACIDQLMKTVAQAKASGNKDALEALRTKYVDGDIIPVKVLEERMLRLPKTSFVYSVKL